MSNPAVSVIIPVRNSERYIIETLNSIKAQTLSDFEAFVVDDGSTDSTASLVEAFCNGDSRFKLIKKPHTNAGDSRNVGMAAANGEYLLFFDADDLMDERMLEVMHANALQYGTDITVCQASSFADDGATEQLEDWRATKVDDWGPFGVAFDRVYRGVDLPYSPFFTCIGWAWDKLFKHSFVKENDLQFQSIESTNDAMFVFAAIALANSIVFIPDSLVNYRQHPGSVSATRSKHPHNAKTAADALRSKLKESPQVWEACGWKCQDWGLSHLRWNYRTLQDEARQEAFSDYRDLMLSMMGRGGGGFHNCEEEWVCDAFAANPGCESMYIADQAIDFGYMKRERDNLLDSLNSLQDAIDNSATFKVGRAVTAVPRAIKKLIER